MSQIEQALNRLYQQKNQRIVLWYDDKRELYDAFDGLTLPDVEKIVVEDNQFGVKYRILREQPQQKFLLYHPGSRPENNDNWLLDVELAYATFSADQHALWLSEVGLPPVEFSDIARDHGDFFRAASRRDALRELLRPDDNAQVVREKLLAVCVGAEPRLDAIWENLLAAQAVDDAQPWHLVGRCNLDGFLWRETERVYGYQSTTRSVRDFAGKLFETGFLSGIGEQETPLNASAVVFLSRWKDSKRHHAAFEAVAEDCAAMLQIPQKLNQLATSRLTKVDLFEEIDRAILTDLVYRVNQRTVDAKTVRDVVRRRRETHWFTRYADPYEAVVAASDLLTAIQSADLTVRSLADGVTRYTATWHLLDRYYRHFIYHVNQSSLTTLFDDLLDHVENRYLNQYLLPLNRQWQPHVDAATSWQMPPIMRQADFYERYVDPVVRRGNKLAVVISDALRYEIGAELLERIVREDRYSAEMTAAVTRLPSTTVLGMATLLPHRELHLAVKGEVLVDGQRTVGTENRGAILAKTLNGRGAAIQARDLLALNRNDSRALTRDNDVVYVYHNRIDATGDKLATEERVFEAAEQALDDLVSILKKLNNANVNNMIVTADHGFLYQQRPLDESDFHGGEVTSGTVTVRNRRFLLGHDLQTSAGFNRFRPEQLGYTGDPDILIPKSINRLRLSGSGSRYVHGGATLHEIVIPIIQVNKKRQSDVETVEIAILRGSTTTITTGQVVVTFYQTQPVSAKVQARTLRVGFYTLGGEPISDVHELRFDFVSTNERERERPVQFILTNSAEKANNQEVLLKLEEREAGTSFYTEYKSARYALRRSLFGDFDEFD